MYSVAYQCILYGTQAARSDGDCMLSGVDSCATSSGTAL